MAAIDVFADIASEFATADQAKVARFIGYASNEVSPDYWGAMTDMAIAYLAAHKLKMAGRDGDQVGALKSEKAGDMAASYSSPQSGGGSVDPLDLTTYGKEYKRLRDATIVAAQLL